MLNTRSSGFFVLPPELRLVIYRHVIASCLTEGLPSHISGLYLSCGAVKAEMEASVAKVRTLLKIQQEWNLDPKIQGNTGIQFELPYEYSFAKAFTNLTIAIPLLRPRDPQAAFVVRKPENFIDLISILRPATCLPLFTLSLKFCRLTSTEDNAFMITLDKVPLFIIGLAITAHEENASICPQIHRLILEAGTAEVPSTPECKHEIDYAIRQMQHFSADLSRHWASRQVVDGCEVWKLGFDFKGGLPVVAGEVMSDGDWKI